MKIQKISYYGMYLAIMLIFGLVPYLGYITIVPGFLTITTMTILIVIATIHLGVGGALLGTLLFALTSFISGMYQGSGLALVLINESLGKWFIVSVFSRVIVGIFVVIVFKLSIKQKLIIRIALISFTTIIANTIFFLLLLSLLTINSGSFWYIFSLSWINIILEWIVTPILIFSLYPLFKIIDKKHIQLEKTHQW